jgi:hypothetical protein
MQSVRQSLQAGHTTPVIRVYDDGCNVIDTHEHKGDLKGRR